MSDCFWTDVLRAVQVCPTTEAGGALPAFIMPAVTSDDYWFAYTDAGFNFFITESTTVCDESLRGDFYPASVTASKKLGVSLDSFACGEGVGVELEDLTPVSIEIKPYGGGVWLARLSNIQAVDPTAAVGDVYAVQITDGTTTWFGVVPVLGTPYLE